MNLLQQVRSIFSRKPHMAHEAASATPAPALHVRAAQVDYPPTDAGLPLASVEQLMEGQAVLIARLKTHAALSSDALFEKRFLAPIRNLAAYILNLPATQDAEFGGPGGLFRASVELAFLAFQASDGAIFTSDPGVEARYEQEPRWRYLCFASGLIWPIGKTLECIRVTSDGKTWPARTGPLSGWAEQVTCTHIYLTWRLEKMTEPGPSVNGSAIAVPILGTEVVEWVESASPRLMTAMIEMSGGIRNDYNSFAYDLLVRMWSKSLHLERDRMPANYGRVKFGNHMAPHLVDAMSRLIADGKWAINKPPLHVDANGVFLMWPDAGTDLIRQLKKDEWRQTPATEAGLLTMLMDEQLLKIDSVGGVLVHVADENGVLHDAVKFVRPNALLPEYQPSDYAPKKSNKKAGANGQASKIEAPTPVVQTAEAPAIVLADAPEVDSAPPRRAPPPAADPLEDTITQKSTGGTSSQIDTASQVDHVASVPDVSDTPSPTASQPMPTRPEIGNKPDDSGMIALPGKRAADPAPATPTTQAKEAATVEKTKPPYGDVAKAAMNNTGVMQVTYKEKLPPAVIKSIGNGLVSEQLARLLDKINEGSNKDQLIITADYVAVPWSFFENTVASPPNFLTSLGEAGYLYFDPTARGKKQHDIPTEPGSKQKLKCFLLARVLTNRVGLTQK